MPHYSSPALGRITSCYGPRPPLPRHEGYDVAPLKPGTPLDAHAIASGRVSKVVRGRTKGAPIGRAQNGIPALTAGMSGNGIIQVFDHPVYLPSIDKLVIGARYGHVTADSFVSVGTHLEAGQKFGGADLSGSSSGKHVHTELYTGSRWDATVDPLLFFAVVGIAANGTPTTAPVEPIYSLEDTMNIPMLVKGDALSEIYAIEPDGLRNYVSNYSTIALINEYCSAAGIHWPGVVTVPQNVLDAATKKEGSR